MFDQRKVTKQISNELHELMAELEEDIEFLGGDKLIEELNELESSYKKESKN